MDRQAFKNRMQKLKSYRENNPGKGYWDWKVSAFVDGGEHTDHGVDKPIIPQRVERIVNGKPWSQLTAKEQFMNRVGYSNGRPQEQGLEIISPEFDVLTGIRSVSTLPKKFLGSNKAIKDVSGNYYRQIDRSSKGIEHAKNSGMVTVNSSAKKQITLSNGQQINLGKTFDVPFWAKDNRWYPDENNIKDVIVSKGDVGLEWKPITQHGGFTTAEKAGSRRTPLFNGEINNTPSDLFEYYRHYPIVGFRNVTEGFPHIPISGINAVTENIDSFADGGEVGDPSVEAIQQRNWLSNWLNSRTKQMAENIDSYSNQGKYGSTLDRIHVSPFFFQDKEKNAKNIIQEQLQYANDIPIYDYREPWVYNDDNTPNRKIFLKQKAGVQGAYHKKYMQPHTISISPIASDPSVILHELTHSTQDKYAIQTNKVDEVMKKYEEENNPRHKYYDDPGEIYSRMNQFRYDNGLNPEDTITEEQIEQFKDSSIDNQFINRYSTNTLLDLLNSVATTFANDCKQVEV